MNIHVSFQTNYQFFKTFYDKFLFTVYNNPAEFAWLNNKILRVQDISYDEANLFKAINSMFFSITYHNFIT